MGVESREEQGYFLEVWQKPWFLLDAWDILLIFVRCVKRLSESTCIFVPTAFTVTKDASYFRNNFVSRVWKAQE